MPAIITLIVMMTLGAADNFESREPFSTMDDNIEQNRIDVAEWERTHN